MSRSVLNLINAVNAASMSASVLPAQQSDTGSQQLRSDTWYYEILHDDLYRLCMLTGRSQTNMLIRHPMGDITYAIAFGILSYISL